MSIWGRCSSGGQPGDHVPLQRVTSDRRSVSPRIVVSLISAVLVVAWWKPWDVQPSSTSPGIAAVVVVPSAESARPASPAGAATPSPDPPDDPSVAAAKRAHCRSTRRWRLLSIEESPRWRTRTLWGATLQEANGPADAGLKVSVNHAEQLTAVGICAPTSAFNSPADQLQQAVLWHVTDDGQVREVENPAVLDAPLYDRGEAYYGPPNGEGPYWAPGRYVFEVRRIGGGADQSRWIGLEFVPTGPR